MTLALLFVSVHNVKILPQAPGNQAMSAFVDFTEVADAKRAFEADLEIDGHHLRSDYNIRRGERREASDRGGDRRDSWGGDRGADRQGGGGYDDRRAHLGRDGFESHRSSGSGSRRERSRSPVRRDRSRERHGSGGSGGDDRYQQRRDYRNDRSPPRSGGSGRDRDFGRNDEYQQQRTRQPRSPPRGNGHDMDPHARMNGNDGSYANGSRGGGGSEINRYVQPATWNLDRTALEVGLHSNEPLNSAYCTIDRQELVTKNAPVEINSELSERWQWIRASLLQGHFKNSRN